MSSVNNVTFQRIKALMPNYKFTSKLQYTGRIQGVENIWLHKDSFDAAYEGCDPEKKKANSRRNVFLLQGHN